MHRSVPSPSPRRGNRDDGIMDPKQGVSAGLDPSDKPGPSDVDDEYYQSAQGVLTRYLLERSEVFRRLNDLQKQASTPF